MEDGGGKLLCQTSLHSKEHVGCRMEEDSLQGHVDGADDGDDDDERRDERTRLRGDGIMAFFIQGLMV